MSKEIQAILRNPPMKKQKCWWCAGKGYHIKGAISAEKCKKCEGTKVMYKQDYPKTEKLIRQVLKSY
jgi:DnaJ-class molecular chaperone